MTLTTVLLGWVVLSVPAALLLGAFLKRGAGPLPTPQPVGFLAAESGVWVDAAANCCAQVPGPRKQGGASLLRLTTCTQHRDRIDASLHDALGID